MKILIIAFFLCFVIDFQIKAQQEPLPNPNYHEVLEWAKKETNLSWSKKLKFTHFVDKHGTASVYIVAGENIVLEDEIFRAKTEDMLTAHDSAFRDCDTIGGQEFCDLLHEMNTTKAVLTYNNLAILSAYILVVKRVQKGPFYIYVKNLAEPYPSLILNNHEDSNLPLLWPTEQREYFKYFNDYYYKWVEDDVKLIDGIYSVMKNTSYVEKYKITRLDVAYTLFNTASRVFGLKNVDGNGKKTLALIPVLDYMNHFPTHGAFNIQRKGDTDDDFIMRATLEYSTGQEIFAKYGQNTNPDLMIVYGFCLANNPAEVITFDIMKYAKNLPEFPGSPEFQEKKKIAIQAFNNETFFKLSTINCFSNTGNNILRFMMMKEDDPFFDRLSESLITGSDIEVSQENEIESYWLFIKIIEDLKSELENVLSTSPNMYTMMKQLFVEDIKFLGNCIPQLHERLAYVKERSPFSFTGPIDEEPGNNN